MKSVINILIFLVTALRFTFSSFKYKFSWQNIAEIIFFKLLPLSFVFFHELFWFIYGRDFFPGIVVMLRILPSVNCRTTYIVNCLSYSSDAAHKNSGDEQIERQAVDYRFLFLCFLPMFYFLWVIFGPDIV